MKIESIIKDSLENDVVLFVSPSEKYKDFLEKIISTYFKKKNKLCLVSLNKSYSNLSQDLKKQKINSDKILFIDCVSKKEGKAKEKDNVFYVPSPRAFTEINITIKEALKAGVEDVIFDSLSTLLIYGNPSVVFKFIQDLITFVKNNNKNVFFTLLKDDLDNKIVKDIQMLVDKVAILGEEIIPAKEDAIKLMENLFGPQAGKLVEKHAKEKNPELLLKEFKSILSKLVGPENAEKQMAELYEKYAKGR